jgi:hypothetical protein
MKDRIEGIALLEEAISLVRIAPSRAWTWYLAGAVPFFAVLLFFIRATTSSLAVPDPGLWSLALALLFGWRQVSRSMFGRVLTSELTGSVLTDASGAWLRGIARTWFAGFLRVAIPLPVPWLSILFRNYQASAWDDDQAFRRAATTSAQGGVPVTGWLTLGALAVCVFLNVLMGIVAIPTLYRIFTGQESEFTRNIGALLNQTVLCAALMIAWCLCDVAFEAMCALQRFYTESESTGADLLRAWRKAIARTSTQLAAAVAIAFCIPAGLHAQPPQNLDKAIDQVLAQKQYQWREAPAASQSESGIVRWMRSVVRSIQHWIHTVTRPLKRLWDAFWRWLLGPGEALDSKGPAPPVDTLHLVLVLLIVLFGGALVALLLRGGIRNRSTAAALSSTQPIPLDLNDPNVAATDLEEEEWLRLAREWTEKGEPRMALRAWFLACLAWLNRRELVSISRNKSNLDYRRELTRRARGIPGLAEQFTACVRRFDSAWYGLYPLDADEVERFAARIQQMRSIAE